MYYALILTLGIFVLPPQVRCQTLFENADVTQQDETLFGDNGRVSSITVSTETERAEDDTETTTQGKSFEITVTKFSRNTKQSTLNANTASEETTIISSTYEEITSTLPSSTPEEITVVVSSLADDITTTQENILTTLFSQEEKNTKNNKNETFPTTITIIDSLSTTDVEKSTSTENIESTHMTSSIGDIDYDNRTFTTKSEVSFTSTVTPIKNYEKTSTINWVTSTEKIGNEDESRNDNSRCVGDGLNSSLKKINFEHKFRNKFETWKDLKERNETNQVNTIVFSKTLEVTEWFVVYDRKFREGLSQIITHRVKQETSVHAATECTPFQPEDITYVAPSPIKMAESVSVSFMLCVPSEKYCLAFENLVAEDRRRLESYLNMTVAAFGNESPLMDFYYDCNDDILSDAVARIIIASTLTLMFVLMILSLILAVTKIKMKYGNFSTRVSYRSTRSLQNIRVSGQNLASDLQCQLEELVERPSTPNNQHADPLATTSYEVIRDQNSRKSKIIVEIESTKNEEIEEKL